MSLVGPQLPPTQLIPPPTVINDENKVYSIAAACIFLGILASLFALTRLVGRIWCRNFGLDDYAAAVALVSSAMTLSYPAPSMTNMKHLNRRSI